MALIERDVLIKRFCGHCIDYGKCIEKCFDVEIIESIPPVDAVPVIRCKDCFHCKQSVVGDYYCIITNDRVDKEDFCSWAERKEE